MTDINELFSRDPHGLSEQDLTQLIQHFRDRRAQFVQGVKAEPKPKTARKSKGSSLLDDIGEIKL